MMDRPPSKLLLALRAGLFFLPFLLIPALAAPASTVADERAVLLEDMGVPAWHAAGWRGQGVKVAVLDPGFRGYKAHLGEALPEHVTVRSFRDDGDLEAKDSQHGILCGEVVHAVAPDAELLLANWEPERPDRFVEAVRWARRQGARIVSCSVVMPTWSDGDGGGEVHQALTDALGKGDDCGRRFVFRRRWQHRPASLGRPLPRRRRRLARMGAGPDGQSDNALGRRNAVGGDVLAAGRGLRACRCAT